MHSQRTNVADRLTAIAAQMPDAVAIASPGNGHIAGRDHYATCSFRELEADATTLARGLIDIGVKSGDRIVLLVKPGIEFVKLVFALLRTGATTVLVDPGMGRKHLINCLAASAPDGFVAISPAQAARMIYRRRFPRARLNVTLGRRWFWGGTTYEKLLAQGRRSQTPPPSTHADDAAAMIFTSGSTGPPKGVLYTHRMFDTQASEIQRAYDLRPGGADLACFALFGLFNSAMGVTTVFPQMDFSRPASADPRKLLAAANDWQVTQAFASPAVWDKLSRHCEATSERIPTLRKVFSCGAPVPAAVLQRTLATVHPDAEMHTPYGATEALPVATIEAREVLGETAARTAQGAGVCVGRKFNTIDWRVIRITDEPIPTIDDTEELSVGEVGELVVRGPQVSPRYVVARNDANPAAKIRDGDAVWHRMGDVGYLDAHGRFWYCGRKSHRVETRDGTLFSECVERIFDAHPDVRQSALIGIGGRPNQAAVICILPNVPIRQRSSIFHGFQPEYVAAEVARLGRNHLVTKSILSAVFLPSFPVDVRHNSKILRELLHDWACGAIIDDIDLYPAELSQRVLSTSNKVKRSPPFAVHK